MDSIHDNQAIINLEALEITSRVIRHAMQNPLKMAHMSFEYDSDGFYTPDEEKALKREFDAKRSVIFVQYNPKATQYKFIISLRGGGGRFEGYEEAMEFLVKHILNVISGDWCYESQIHDKIPHKVGNPTPVPKISDKDKKLFTKGIRHAIFNIFG